MPCFATTLFETWLLICDDVEARLQTKACWDTCDVEPGCMAAVYNGTTCWHTATVRPNNVEWGIRLWVHVCSVTKVCMKKKLEDEADHMEDHPVL
jgi:hypothetical protein